MNNFERRGPQNFYFLMEMLLFVSGPLLMLLRRLAPLFAPIQSRLSWELAQTPYKHFALKKMNKQVVAAFEVSSEGEWQQVVSLAEKLLERGHAIEIIAASQSLSALPQRLQKQWANYPGQFALIWLPLLSFGHHQQIRLQDWLSAPVLIFCRYDFYPHLLLLKKQKHVALWLLNASFKSRQRFWWFGPKRWWDRWLFSQFDCIVLASHPDQLLAHQLFPERNWSWQEAEFRSQLIAARLLRATDTLQAHPIGKLLCQWKQQHENSKLLVMGNVWPREMDFLASDSFQKFFTQKGRLLIVPHLVDGPVGDFFRGKDWRGPVAGSVVSIVDQQLLDLDRDQLFSAQVVVVLAKGLLVELYSLGQVAFVGGGHGRSIHSVLEPFIAGLQVLCGPQTHRSSEWDQITWWDATRVGLVHDLAHYTGEIKATDRRQLPLRAQEEMEQSQRILLDIVEKLSSNNGHET